MWASKIQNFAFSIGFWIFDIFSLLSNFYQHHPDSVILLSTFDVHHIYHMCQHANILHWYTVDDAEMYFHSFPAQEKDVLIFGFDQDIVRPTQDYVRPGMVHIFLYIYCILCKRKIQSKFLGELREPEPTWQAQAIRSLWDSERTIYFVVIIVRGWGEHNCVGNDINIWRGYSFPQFHKQIINVPT